MRSEKLLFYFLFIFRKTVLFFGLSLLFFPFLNTILELLINQSKMNFLALYQNSFVRFLTMDYSEINAAEIQIAGLNSQQIFFHFFGQSFWLLCTVLIPTLFVSFGIGIKLALNVGNKKNQLTNMVVRWLNLVPTFLLVPLIIVVFVKFSQNTTFVTLDETNFWISLQSFIPLWISLFLPICLLMITIVKNLVLKHIRSAYYIMVLAMGKPLSHLIFRVILRNVIIDLLPYLMGIYALCLSFGIIAERSFFFNGQSFILNFAFNRGEVSIIVFSLFFNIAFVYAIQVLLKLILMFVIPLDHIKPKSKYGIIESLKKHKIRKLNVEKGAALESHKI